MTGEPSRASVVDRILSPVVVFAGLYVALLWIVSIAFAMAGIPYYQWAALIAVSIATPASMWILRDRASIGLVVDPLLALRHFAAGFVFATALLLLAHGIVLLVTPTATFWAARFPYAELIAVYVPAALHEELLFRGFAFQRLFRSTGVAAVVASSALFALLHIRNNAISGLALANIFLAGLLLALLVVLARTLWIAIGLHLWWNVFSGPVLGYAVSGFPPRDTVFVTRALGSLELTGGRFGIEGSVAATAVELVAVCVAFALWRRRRNADLHAIVTDKMTPALAGHEENLEKQ